MSRSNYSDDCENVELWRQAVRRATTGRRGQVLLLRLRDALDAMPVKRLIAHEVQSENGEVCALGALDASAPFKEYEPAVIAKHFGIAPALAAEIMWQNDEAPSFVQGVYVSPHRETPEQRWTRMRAWIDEQTRRPQ